MSEFQQMILGNLAKAGIYNGRRNERPVVLDGDITPGDYCGLESLGQ